MKKHPFIKCDALLLLCSLLLGVFLAGCCINIDYLFKAEHEKTEHLSAPFAAEQTLYLHNDVGEIIITGADVNDCNVTAIITTKAMTAEKAEKLAEEVQIKLEPSDNKLYIRVEKPIKMSKHSITIDFNIIVPKQTALQLATKIGAIQIANITQPIKVQANIGAVSCREITSNIDIQTNIGEVKVLYSKTAPGTCNANIKTNIGEINFATPPDLSAQVNISVNIGSIQTDRPLTVKGIINKSLSSTIGKGEGKVILKTNIGAIKIK
jgi:predicted membrane protein